MFATPAVPQSDRVSLRNRLTHQTDLKDAAVYRACDWLYTDTVMDHDVWWVRDHARHAENAAAYLAGPTDEHRLFALVGLTDIFTQDRLIVPIHPLPDATVAWLEGYMEAYGESWRCDTEALPNIVHVVLSDKFGMSILHQTNGLWLPMDHHKTDLLRMVARRADNAARLTPEQRAAHDRDYAYWCEKLLEEDREAQNDD